MKYIPNPEIENTFITPPVSVYCDPNLKHNSSKYTRLVLNSMIDALNSVFSVSRLRYKITFTFIIIGLWHISASGYMLGKAHLSQYLIKQAWHKTLQDKANHKPWSWADTYPVFEISVPRLNENSYVLSGANGRSMAFSAAHITNSGQPGGPKTTIVSGHRDSHFEYLKNIKLGDKIYTVTKNNTYTYIVNSIKIIDSKKEKLIIQNINELVLTTCYPFNSLQFGGNLRYVVSSKPE